MDRLRKLEILTRVADAGSFARAARLLLITPSAVSHAITTLERELGVVLFYRTTRQLQVSTEGAEVLRHAREALATLSRIESVSTSQRDRAAGTLKLGAPPGFARHVLMPMLPEFNRRYPDIRIEMRNSGSVVDMHLSGADLHFRIGPVADSSLVVRPLARLRFGVYASPGYLARHGIPASPEQLRAHRTLVHKSPRSSTIAPWDQWTYERDGVEGAVQVGHHLVTDDREALLEAAIAGAGLFRMGMFSPALLSSGRLVRVLEQWQWPGAPALSMLYRRMPRVPRRIAVFMAFAEEAVRAFDPMGLTLEARVAD
ncbi:MAG: LysR family transcriptional regulator [Rhodocyclaceae bacterium]|nr:LysR family transcriptional regulator [Rhodocyclaceae bacterium]MCA3076842.1 LysR family transcriptional regulator [Rhodocyclaceae bacterium]MCA3090014.1 LysR family transcriptional regulator [Rhodocyclaceae bacterium]MCA3093662.1 LysR family transcriptional regulator [Rhodocyclaceae bacterium]MCA3099473.1 LysR family transcriptional regulator [Rhodocyclaceae bacterium]